MVSQALKHVKNYDEYLTPAVAVKPIIKYLNKDMTIWECTGQKSNITNVLAANGYRVIETHKNTFDFLKDKPKFEFDAIITNPPYSLKFEFLKKCYEYEKPFALLMPLTALEGIQRNKLYRKYGIQLIVFDRRVQFLEGKTNWFATAWFCYKILDKDLIFTELEV